MKIISITDTTHNFNKTNLVTVKGGGDNYACDCGVKGYRPAFTDMLQVTDAMFKQASKDCPLAKPTAKKERPKTIEITHCQAVGKVFANLTDGSQHAVVDCPESEPKFKNDVWVMGVGEPVRLLPHEYKAIE